VEEARGGADVGRHGDAAPVHLLEEEEGSVSIRGRDDGGRTGCKSRDRRDTIHPRTTWTRDRAEGRTRIVNSIFNSNRQFVHQKASIFTLKHCL